jgi:hypothetical protein
MLVKKICLVLAQVVGFIDIETIKNHSFVIDKLREMLIFFTTA